MLRGSVAFNIAHRLVLIVANSHSRSLRQDPAPYFRRRPHLRQDPAAVALFVPLVVLIRTVGHSRRHVAYSVPFASVWIIGFPFSILLRHWLTHRP